MSETTSHSDKHGHGAERRTPDTTRIQNPDVLHEVSDVNVRAILKFIGALAVGTAIVFGIASGLLRGFAYAADKFDPQTESPLALKGDERLPPEPRIQLSKGWNFEGKNLELQEPQKERELLFERWHNELEKGGVDPKTGAVQMPIEKAKGMIVEQHLPARTSSATGQPSGGKVTGEGLAAPSVQSAGQQTEGRDK